MIEPGKPRPSRTRPDSVTNKCINLEKLVMTKHMKWHKNHKPYDTVPIRKKKD